MHPLSSDFKRKHVETKYLEKHKVSGGWWGVGAVEGREVQIWFPLKIWVFG